jgi:FAD dependent oxidoreductase
VTEVPVCISASHVAFSSVRMEVQYQMLGHAAGLAAASASASGRAVQDVDVAALRERLAADGQVLAV